MKEKLHPLKSESPTILCAESQTRQWIRLAQGGDPEARNNLLRTHFPLVVYLVKKYYRPGSFMEMPDLIQQGCLGLLMAIERFDLNRKRNGKQVRFNTYVGLCVMQHVLREIDNHERTIAVPVNVQAYLRSAARAKRLSGQESSDSLLLERTATAFGMTPESARSLRFTALHVVPLEMPSEDDEPLERAIPSRAAQSADLERLFAQQDHRDHLRRLLDGIPERERFVIEHHYGLLPGGTPKTLRQIAGLLRLCPDRVRQIENRAIKRMREQMPELVSKQITNQEVKPPSKKWRIADRYLVLAGGSDENYKAEDKHHEHS
jgi:RNA polymerase primary sigma factor